MKFKNGKFQLNKAGLISSNDWTSFSSDCIVNFLKWFPFFFQLSDFVPVMKLVDALYPDNEVCQCTFWNFELNCVSCQELSKDFETLWSLWKSFPPLDSSVTSFALKMCATTVEWNLIAVFNLVQKWNWMPCSRRTWGNTLLGRHCPELGHYEVWWLVCYEHPKADSLKRHGSDWHISGNALYE